MEQKRIDLHTHSLASDGDLTPARLVEEAYLKGIRIMALTDHDSVDGIADAKNAAEKKTLSFICGTEISTGTDGRTHLLAYGFAKGTEEIEGKLISLKQDRENRFREMSRLVEKKFGVTIDSDELIRKARGSIGRPRLADEMVRLGLAGDRNEAFERFIGDNGPCYVPHQPFLTSEAIGMVRDCGGVPVIAHPGLIRDTAGFRRMLPEWVKAGLMGMEVYYPAHRRTGYEPWRRLAEEYGLLVTGGSDFHRFEDGDLDHGGFGCTQCDWKDAAADAEKLMRAAGL